MYTTGHPLLEWTQLAVGIDYNRRVNLTEPELLVHNAIETIVDKDPTTQEMSRNPKARWFQTWRLPRIFRRVETEGTKKYPPPVGMIH